MQLHDHKDVYMYVCTQSDVKCVYIIYQLLYGTLYTFQNHACIYASRALFKMKCLLRVFQIILINIRLKNLM